MENLINKVIWADCFDVFPKIEDGSVDMILCDLPYGTTQNAWDSVLPLDRLWKEYKRIIKPSGVIALTASMPFTIDLINPARDIFRYSMVWDKAGTTGFQLAKKRPLKRHEDVLIFYKREGNYNPIMEVRGLPRKKGGSQRDNGNFGDLRSTESFNNEYYPTSILDISNASKANLIHPTQKPVSLFERLIKLYSNEGDLVLDNCAGSFTTAVAAINTNRNFICIEQDITYVQAARERLGWKNDYSKFLMIKE